MKDNPRYLKTPVAPHDRPRAYYKYFVTGRGEFPFDMLRYDRCWPADPTYIPRPEGQRRPRTVELRSYKAPTVERWASFLWSVSETDPQFERG